MGEESVLLVDSLRFSYGAVLALDGISFSIDRPAVFSLLGPNGSGKSTLFRILCGALAPQSGRVTIIGADLLTRRRDALSLLGVVFQQPGLDSKLTARENVTYHGRLYGLSGASLKSRAMDLLERFGVADRAADRVDTLSGGLRRRVELAKALIHAPRVLILDEPGTGLDPGARATMMHHLRELKDRDGVTSLLTTHLMDEADVCDAVGILDAGRLTALDSPTALKSTIGGDVITIESASPDTLAERLEARFRCRVDKREGILRMEKKGGHEFLPQLVEAFPGEINGVSFARPTLGDVYFHLTGHPLHRDDRPSGDGASRI
jgi:ABC-2 type transport system ATP-binding protein